ncbi:MAG: lysine--tRNA ligase [candidate division WOR-3 bacterium]
MNPEPASGSGHDREVRLEKLARLQAQGVNVRPYRYDRTHSCQAVIERFAELENSEVRVAGRLMSRREHGKTQFGHIQDASGRLQLYLRQDTLGPEAFARLGLFDLGDLVGARGRVFRTRTGEVTVNVEELVLLGKSLWPLPEKFHGLRDIETRYRQRYVDLLVNEEARRVLLTRSRIISLIRDFLSDRGFIEVETPILQPIYGGAAARPFTTWYDVLEQQMFLRISDELYLKRLIVGGLEKVFEIGRDFRNEGLDRTHNPEFTQMELYWAYADYHDVMKLTEELFAFLALKLHGRTEIPFGDHIVDLGRWQRLKFVDALAQRIGADPLRLPVSDLKQIAARFNMPVGENPSRARLLDKLFTELIQDRIIDPTFVLDHPKVTTPLARTHRANPELVERFEPVVCGMELGNAFSELADPLEQRQRFEQAVAQNEEFATVDEDYCTALEYGMPPTGGLGIGIDRLTMLLTNAPNIRDVILFPQLRPDRQTGPRADPEAKTAAQL